MTENNIPNKEVLEMLENWNLDKGELTNLYKVSKAYLKLKTLPEIGEEKKVEYKGGKFLFRLSNNPRFEDSGNSEFQAEQEKHNSCCYCINPSEAEIMFKTVIYYIENDISNLL